MLRICSQRTGWAMNHILVSHRLLIFDLDIVSLAGYPLFHKRSSSLSPGNIPRWQAGSSKESEVDKLQQLANVSSVADQTTYLHCPVTGKDGEKLEWFRGNQLLPANHRQYIFPNGTLAIHRVDARLDAGEYRCKMDNGHGPITVLEYHLLVIVPPRIDPISFPNDLSPGARVRVSCMVSRGDPPLEIEWYKDGQLLTSSFAKELNIAVQDVDEFASFLAISSLGTVHAGNYSCMARNRIAQDSKSARLTVNVPVYWISEPLDASAQHQTTLHLDCAANGNPTPVIEWKRMITGSLGNYTPLASPRIKTLKNGTLVINELQREDDGHYLCQASNGIGPAISKVIKVAVKAPPYFEKDFETVTASLGSTASLGCYTHGDLPIMVTWFRDDSPLETRPPKRYSWLSQPMPKNGYNSVMTINGAKREDTGVYVCRASNEFGVRNKSVKFLVQERPEAPLNVALVAQNSRMAQIGWTGAFDGNSPVINFILEWKTPAGLWTDDGVKREYTPGNSSEFTLTQLQPDTAYQIRVRALNTLGQSDPSSSISVRTDEEAPSEGPREVVAESPTSTSIILTWKAPASGHNGRLLGYIIGYKLSNSTEGFAYKTVKSDGKRDESVKLKDLRKYAPYAITVQAYNKMGSGPKVELHDVWTMEDVPSDAPRSIKAQPLSSQRISLTWDQLPQESINGILLGYKVFYKPSLDWTSQPYMEVVHETKCVLDGLKKFSNYTINVLAFTKIGDGVSSSPINIQTLSDVPSEPADLKAVTKSPTSILLTWKEPLEKNGVIKFYNVYIRSENSKRDRKRLVYPSVTLNQFEVSDLTQNEYYEFWVSAETDAGEGPATDRIRQAAQSVGRAAIASFSEFISRPIGSNAVLPCLAVGYPYPKLDWIKDGRKIDDRSFAEVLSNGSLYIKRIQPNDAGNYTCKVSNLYGTDFIHITLLVQQRPLPPIAKLLSSSSNVLDVEWFVPNDRGSTVREFVLYYRPGSGSTKSISLPANFNSYKLQHLLCGQQYHIYMTARNEIGMSDQSLPLVSRTHGQAPIAPDLQSFLVANSTSVHTFLNTWKSGGCHIKYFAMKYQAQKEGAPWRTVAEVIPGDTESITIDDLTPETTYVLKVTATNDAGTTEKEFHFSTLTESGDAIPVLLQNDKSTGNFHESQGNIFLITGVVVAALLVMVAVGLLYHKRRSHPKFLPVECNVRRDLDDYRERTPKKPGVQSPWKTIAQYSDQKNNGPISLANTPKTWQPPLRIENELTPGKYGSPKRLNTNPQFRIYRPPASQSQFDMGIYQTPSNRPLVRDESTPDSGFSGSNLKHTDCDTFQRASIVRASASHSGSHSDSSDAQPTQKLNVTFHKTRPKPAPRRRPPTRSRQTTSSSLQRVAKAATSSSSTPSSVEDLPRREPKPRKQPQIHFPSPPHSEGDEMMPFQPNQQHSILQYLSNGAGSSQAQRFSFAMSSLPNHGRFVEDCVDGPNYEPTTTV